MKGDESLVLDYQVFFQEHPTLLPLLLLDKTTKKNIIWATEDYSYLGKGYGFKDQIKPELISGKNKDVITPRVEKVLQIQTDRSKNMAEVFTPAWICNLQNNRLDAGWFGDDFPRFNKEKDETWETIDEKVPFPETDGKTWLDYVDSTRIEISCGEAPYLTSRYDVVSGRPIKTKDRVGLLDRKLRVIGENTDIHDEWEKRCIRALKSVYGFEWQGDNVLLARQNILFTCVEYFFDKFGQYPPEAFSAEMIDIITWNIWQMDGIKCVIPMSCHEKRTDLGYDLITGEYKVETEPCPGCAKGSVRDHNGIYSWIMDWNLGKKIKFVDVIGGKRHARVRHS